MLTLEDLVAEFSLILRLSHIRVGHKIEEAAREFLDYQSNSAPLEKHERKIRLIGLVNSKFDINKSAVDNFLSSCAKNGVTFNYHDKNRISEAFDRSTKSVFFDILRKSRLPIEQYEGLFSPASLEETVQHLHCEIRSPTLSRKDSKPKDWTSEIIESLLGGFVFLSYPAESAHMAFSCKSSNYESDFWGHIHVQNKKLLSREKSLTYLHVNENINENDIYSVIRNEYETLSNHGHLAIYFPEYIDNVTRKAGMVTLFAEKFRSELCKSNYFRWREVEQNTRSYIGLNPEVDYSFNFMDTGFHYKDTFVFADGESLSHLLIFQKNVADETPLACPSCRSTNVQGNSYPSLGVKSWECNNPICPDRSKFNRGKRYSFLQLLKQNALGAEENRVTRESVRKWSRDIQPTSSIRDIIPMLISHYSLAGDGILLVGTEDYFDPHRNILFSSWNKIKKEIDNTASQDLFNSSSFFKRWLVQKENIKQNSKCDKVSIKGVSAIKGDSNDALYTIEEESIDGAITSPPYYNAREYSQWSNIYCYLYDMLNNARAVFRVLKPGATYLFNIFDYFDNEKIVTFSAMGQKRMILSAYCVKLFEEAGFECVGNIVWDKGDIEGKRAFNGGNFSPYYQAPFNCWEHILVFRKPGNEVQLNSPLPMVLRAKPVFKMIRGENMHGHSAPFPEAIPRLILDRLPETAVVLDPYSGSMTTGMAAIRSGHRAICIEKQTEYFKLGVRKLEETTAHSSLI